MKIFSTLFLSAAIGLSATAQTTITNGDFETWGNTSPGVSSEPTSWYSNKSGSSNAILGPQTCYQDNSIKHGGVASVRVESKAVPIVGTVVNGVVTTGVVNAPTFSKDSGYIGTVNFSTTSDDRRMSFTGRPDSIVGWYQYIQGGASEQGKIRAILHTGDYYDPETPTTEHPDPTANKIADALFLTPMSNVASWTRFSIPFTYTSSSSPAYIMINVTSSADQLTTVEGSKMWLDDVAVVYNPSTEVKNTVLKEEDANVYAYNKMVCVKFAAENQEQSVLTLLDVTGKKVFVQQVANNAYNSFNLSNLNTGIYVYQLSNSNYCKTGKLFIQ